VSCPASPVEAEAISMPRQQRRMTLNLMQARIEAFNNAHGGGVVVRKDAHGYSLFRDDTGEPVARLRPEDSSNLMEVLCWSWRGRWDSIGDFGGVWMPLDEALDYIAEDPEGCFWH
jgi:hypothetical protein